MAKSNNNQKGVKKITITYGKLFHELSPAIRIIGEANGIKDVNTIMNIVKTRKSIDSIIDDFVKTRKKIVEELADKHEDGRAKTKKINQKNPVTGEEQEVIIMVYKDEETQRQASIKAIELDETKVTFDIYPVEFKNINMAKFGNSEGVPANILVAAGDFIILE